jgi:acyl carrier protein
MNLIVALEEEFKVEFTDDEILEMMNYALIESIITGK